MILLDLNQTIIASLMAHIGSNPKVEIQENMVRHIVLNSIRSFSRQFKSKYGELVICCDNKNYWRRDVFPFYKAHRKKDREKSDFDWNLIFNTLNKIKEELKEFSPYRVIEVEYAEADDIIAVLTKRFSGEQSILILSSDKDFVQLQKYKDVRQYSPAMKRFINTDNPYAFIKEHIIRGDRGDGVPNFLSADNVFALGERQKSINNRKLVEWLDQNPEDFCTNDQMLRGFKRNQMLVDFDHIPEEIRDKILNAYENTIPNKRQVFLTYMMKKNMRNLIQDIGDF
ncbi:MAG: hypothetical protein BV459_06835 [Thermoplasmata archaeon M11B2D]|nr:MAG: hypothetical protein BV459_06835 [Thermoplasmata archaeon M11B2D]